MSTFDNLTEKVIKFRDARDWKQFHNPKDVALSLMLEAAELGEHFQWKDADEIRKHVESKREEVGEELADVLYWVLLLSHDLGIDLVEALKDKMKKNDEKYPIEKAKGSNKKYNNL